MASSSSLTTIPLHEPVFQQFLHDVHHAYLLLHRAMSLLPPTLIPNIEPTPLPSTGVWDQPPGFSPEPGYSDETNAYIDAAPLPPPDLRRRTTSCRTSSSTICLSLINMWKHRSPSRSLHHRSSLRHPPAAQESEPPERRPKLRANAPAQLRSHWVAQPALLRSGRIKPRISSKAQIR
jgi:hypothetical protein